MSTPTKPIAVGADEAAFELKGKIVVELGKSLVDIWLASDYQGGRSAPKVDRLKEIDDQFHKVMSRFHSPLCNE